MLQSNRAVKEMEIKPQVSQFDEGL